VSELASAAPWDERLRARLAKISPKLKLGFTLEVVPVVLARERIYTLPTRFGVFFGAVALLCVFGGLNYNNNVVLIMAFLVAAIGFVSLLYAFLNLREVRVLGAHASPVFAGEPAQFQIHLDAPSARESLVIDWRNVTRVGDLDGREPAAFALVVPTTTRGMLPLPAFRLWTDYPFGLFYAWSHVRIAASAVVYPTPETNAPGWPATIEHEGASAARHVGDDDLVGLKPYASGDRAQRIAWAVYARSDELAVKDFRRAHSPRLRFDLAACGGGDLEARLSRLCAWILRAEAERRDYSLTLGALQIASGRGREQRDRCLEALARYSP
jgi:uncharacterized protein (DUF58 family)